MIGLTKSAALEYASRAVRVIAVCPGTIDTPMVAEMLQSGPTPQAVELIRRRPALEEYFTRVDAATRDRAAAPAAA